MEMGHGASPALQAPVPCPVIACGKLGAMEPKGSDRSMASCKNYLHRSDSWSEVPGVTLTHGAGPGSAPAFPMSGYSLMLMGNTPRCTGRPERSHKHPGWEGQG